MEAANCVHQVASFSDVLTFAVPAYDFFLTFSMSSDGRALAAVFTMTEAKRKDHHVINDLRTLSFSIVIYWEIVSRGSNRLSLLSILGPIGTHKPPHVRSKTGHSNLRVCSNAVDLQALFQWHDEGTSKNMARSWWAYWLTGIKKKKPRHHVNASFICMLYRWNHEHKQCVNDLSILQSASHPLLKQPRYNPKTFMTYLQTRWLSTKSTSVICAWSKGWPLSAMRFYDNFSTLRMKHSCNVFARSVAANSVCCALMSSVVEELICTSKNFLHTWHIKNSPINL